MDRKEPMPALRVPSATSESLKRLTAAGKGSKLRLLGTPTETLNLTAHMQLGCGYLQCGFSCERLLTASRSEECQHELQLGKRVAAFDMRLNLLPKPPFMTKASWLPWGGGQQPGSYNEASSQKGLQLPCRPTVQSHLHLSILRALALACPPQEGVRGQGIPSPKSRGGTVLGNFAMGVSETLHGQS